MKVSTKVFLHDGLEKGLKILCGTQWESNVGPHIQQSDQQIETHFKMWMFQLIRNTLS